MNTLHWRSSRCACLLLAAVTAGCLVPSPANPPTTTPTSRPSTAPATAFTETPRPEPTWTPFPTLLPQEAAATLQDLLATNRGCSLPCWWGITPGKTAWEEARHFLATFARIEAGTPGNITINGQVHAVQPYSVSYMLDGETREAAYLYVREGLVSGMSLGKDSTAGAYVIRDLLRANGTPTAVLINTFSAPGPSSDPGGFLPFRVLALYRDLGFMAFYNFEGTLSGSNVVGCPADTAGRIHSWSLDEASWWTYERIREVTLGQRFEFDPSPIELKPLGQVTSWTLSAFNSVFTSDNGTACIETSTDNWR